MMPETKSKEIIGLALSLLDDAELGNGSVEALVLKALRLARLVNDAEALHWLQFEIAGYIKGDPISLKYMSRTKRWTDREAEMGFWGSAATQEANLASSQERLKAAQGYSPANPGAYNVQMKQVSTIAEGQKVPKRIISAIRAEIQSFATRIYHEKVFSGQAASIFSKFQDDVDAVLSTTAETAFKRLPEAFDRLSQEEVESISHAMTTCRRVIDSFADSIYPPKSSPVSIGSQSIEVGPAQTRNRLRAYIYDHIGSGARYDRLSRSIGSLYDRTSAGVHADIEMGEARALVLQTYMLLGELLSLPGAK